MALINSVAMAQPARCIVPKDRGTKWHGRDKRASLSVRDRRKGERLFQLTTSFRGDSARGPAAATGEAPWRSCGDSDNRQPLSTVGLGGRLGATRFSRRSRVATTSTTTAGSRPCPPLPRGKLGWAPSTSNRLLRPVALAPFGP